MVIDWTAAPEGTTHATIPNGDPRWYKLADGKVFCWGIRIQEWAPSFFLTVEEISETGLRLYANGEQSELVMLKKERDDLLVCLKWMVGTYERENAARNELSSGVEYFAAIAAISRSENR